MSLSITASSPEFLLQVSPLGQLPPPCQPISSTCPSAWLTSSPMPLYSCTVGSNDTPQLPASPHSASLLHVCLESGSFPISPASTHPPSLGTFPHRQENALLSFHTFRKKKSKKTPSLIPHPFPMISPCLRSPLQQDSSQASSAFGPHS